MYHWMTFGLFLLHGRMNKMTLSAIMIIMKVENGGMFERYLQMEGHGGTHFLASMIMGGRVVKSRHETGVFLVLMRLLDVEMTWT